MKKILSIALVAIMMLTSLVAIIPMSASAAAADRHVVQYSEPARTNELTGTTATANDGHGDWTPGKDKTLRIDNSVLHAVALDLTSESGTTNTLTYVEYNAANEAKKSDMQYADFFNFDVYVSNTANPESKIAVELYDGAYAKKSFTTAAVNTYPVVKTLETGTWYTVSLDITEAIDFGADGNQSVLIALFNFDRCLPTEAGVTATFAVNDMRFSAVADTPVKVMQYSQPAVTNELTGTTATANDGHGDWTPGKDKTFRIDNSVLHAVALDLTSESGTTNTLTYVEYNKANEQKVPDMQYADFFNFDVYVSNTANPESKIAVELYDGAYAKKSFTTAAVNTYPVAKTLETGTWYTVSLDITEAIDFGDDGNQSVLIALFNFDTCLPTEAGVTATFAVNDMRFSDAPADPRDDIPGTTEPDTPVQPGEKPDETVFKVSDGSDIVATVGATGWGDGRTKATDTSNAPAPVLAKNGNVDRDVATYQFTGTQLFIGENPPANSNSVVISYLSPQSYDISAYNYLVLDLYVSHAADIQNSQFTVELTSSGKPDQNENCATMKQLSVLAGKELVDGWNKLVIPITSLNKMNKGGCDFTNWNYMRIYYDTWTVEGEPISENFTIAVGGLSFSEKSEEDLLKVEELVGMFTAIKDIKTEADINADNYETIKDAFGAANAAWGSASDVAKEMAQEQLDIKTIISTVNAALRAYRASLETTDTTPEDTTPADTTPADTKPAETEPAEKKGCKSTVLSGAVVITLAVAGCVAVKRKKEND